MLRNVMVVVTVPYDLWSSPWNFLLCRKVIDVDEVDGEETRLLVKWLGLPYSESTYEMVKDLEAAGQVRLTFCSLSSTDNSSTLHMSFNARLLGLSALARFCSQVLSVLQGRVNLLGVPCFLSNLHSKTAAHARLRTGRALDQRRKSRYVWMPLTVGTAVVLAGCSVPNRRNRVGRT